MTLSSPVYGGGVKGEGDDVNRVEFAFPAEIAEPSLWIRPIDIGLEFGATWRSSAETPSIGLNSDTGGPHAELAEDGRTIRFIDATGAFAGRISLPILREGGEDGPRYSTRSPSAFFPISTRRLFDQLRDRPGLVPGPGAPLPVILDRRGASARAPVAPAATTTRAAQIHLTPRL